MTLPGCFGVFWEGIASNPDCSVKCGARDECKAKFATETLAKYQRELGDAATPHSLSELTGVKPEAILLAINYQQSLAKSQVPQRSPVQADPPPAEVVPGEAAPSDWDPEKVQEEGAMPPPVSEDQEVPVPPPVGESAPVDAPTAAPVEPIVEEPPQEVAPAPADQPAPQVKKPPRKKAASKTKAAPKKKKAAPATKKPGAKKEPTKKPPGKKAASKKKSPPKGKGTTSNFREAGAASRVAAPAKRRTAKSAARAKVPVGSRTWSPEHNLARFKRERKRSPLIRKLKPGYVLNREFPMGSGINHRVVVERDNYKYRGKKYPTLYAVVKAIMGTKPHKKQLRSDGTRPRGTRELIPWSAVKFFGLAKLMLTLPEERQGKGKEPGRKRRKKK